MAFNSDLISREDILDAIDFIDSNKPELNPSTAYDVIVNDRPYPPKEVIRLAYKLATGDEVGIIYGGEAVNKIFKELQFHVVAKIRFWKLGCHWERGNPSFFNIIQENKIVITVKDFPYGINDIVLITEGFTVYAIAKVISVLKPITERTDLKNDFVEKKIPYDKSILYSDVEWLDLNDNQIFQYKLQQGIRQVHKREVINDVLDIWDNRNAKLDKIQFYVKDFNEHTDPHWHYPCMILIPTKWDDYGYKTCFDLYYYKDSSARDAIDVVKILQKDKQETLLPTPFTQLDDEFCTLGQTLSYYKRLRSEFPYEFMDIGKAMNDCVLYPEIKKDFENLEGFQVSLLRSSEAQKALSEFSGSLLEDLSSSQSFEFEFEYQLPEAAAPHKVDFSFFQDMNLQNRFFCFIGKNGTGKTQFLVQLAKKLSNYNEEGTFKPSRPLFSKIIAVSFSIFDKFEQPKKKEISYDLISFKDNEGLMNEDEISNKLWRAYRLILKSRIKKNIWLNCVKTSLELDYIQFNLEDFEILATKQEFSEKLDKIFSSGQKIIFHLFTRLISSIERNSLIIFDEPETHLHPNVAGRMIKTLNSILNNFHSFCIMATHSPIVVQEIPSRYIRIFERDINIPNVFPPSIEVFGENLSNINNEIFHVDEEKELYKVTLDALIKNFSIKEIEQIFSYKLSLNARLYLQTKTRQIQ